MPQFLFQNRASGNPMVAISNGMVMPLIIDGNTKPFGIKCIVTHIGIKANATTQFMKTLRNNCYIYVFGDDVSDFVASGYAFSDTCWNNQQTAPFSGTDSIFTLYGLYKASSYPFPLLVQLNNFVFYVFIVGMTLETADPATGLYRFSFMFKNPPFSPN